MSILTSEQIEHYKQRFIDACEHLVASNQDFDQNTFFDHEDGSAKKASDFDLFIEPEFLINDELSEEFGESTHNPLNRSFYYKIVDRNDKSLVFYHWAWSQDAGIEELSALTELTAEREQLRRFTYMYGPVDFPTRFVDTLLEGTKTLDMHQYTVTNSEHRMDSLLSDVPKLLSDGYCKGAFILTCHPDRSIEMREIKQLAELVSNLSPDFSFTWSLLNDDTLDPDTLTLTIFRAK